jgi:hypothetical protein
MKTRQKFILLSLSIIFVYQTIVWSQSVKVYMKDEAISESIAVRPRINIKNTGSTAISNFIYYYYLTADNGKTPVVDTYWAPGCAVSLENLGNGNYRVIYNFNGTTLQPGQVFPGNDGNCIGIHQPDWSPVNKTNDFSYIATSSFVENDHIAVYLNGRRIYGKEPFDNAASVIVYMKDEGISENYITKPRIKIKNIGSSAISNFIYYYYLTADNNKTPVVDTYWAPGCVVSLENIGNSNFRVVYNFNGTTLQPGQVFPGNDGNVIGIHQPDWTPVNKANDYSYIATSSFVENNHIPVYVNGTLIYGIPPNTDVRTKRGLCVIADFANASLEDYAGDPSAINSIPELRQEVLDPMEDHWKWMSVGTEIMEWDIIRVRLSQNLSPDAFSAWWDYRIAVAQLALAEVNLNDYDYDNDGVLDAMFVIASSLGNEYDYLIGGMSQNGGARLFVDGQTSLSLRVRAIGNFNHETGHCFDLPDQYGTVDNVGFLTLMSNSWPIPPFGFSSWDRYKLKWYNPVFVSQSTSGIILKPAEDSLNAVIIPTTNPLEYFLVEFRKKPSSGYGTSTPVNYNGLAIYHIWEGRNNNIIPPLIRLEPVDGNYSDLGDPDQIDFWYPENPIMTSPFRARPYYNESSTLFELGNISRTTNGGMMFDITVFPNPSGLTKPDNSVNYKDNCFINAVP